MLIPRLKGQEAGIIIGRSICPHCQKTLGFLDLIPVFSFLIRAGRCHYCHKKISAFYPTIELTTGLAFYLIGQHLIGQADWAMLVLFLTYAIVLIIIFFYDLLYLEIPDLVLLPMIGLTLLVSFFPNEFIPSTKDALIGAAIPVGFFLAQILVSSGRWLGGGDLRIGAFMGLILGYKLVIVALLISYFVGSVVSLILIINKKLSFKTQVPFGPFLSIGTFITLIWGKEILNWYLNTLIQ